MASLALGATFVSDASAAAGDLDPSFSGDGKVSTTFGKWESYATAVAVQPDGKIGVTSGVFAVGRYNADGTLDSTFSKNGKVLTWDGKGGRVCRPGRSPSSRTAGSWSSAGVEGRSPSPVSSADVLEKRRGPACARPPVRSSSAAASRRSRPRASRSLCRRSCAANRPRGLAAGLRPAREGTSTW
jgi:hypothetical protein